MLNSLFHMNYGDEEKNCVLCAMSLQKKEKRERIVCCCADLRFFPRCIFTSVYLSLLRFYYFIILLFLVNVIMSNAHISIVFLASLYRMFFLLIFFERGRWCTLLLSDVEKFSSANPTNLLKKVFFHVWKID